MSLTSILAGYLSSRWAFTWCQFFTVGYFKTFSGAIIAKAYPGDKVAERLDYVAGKGVDGLAETFFADLDRLGKEIEGISLPEAAAEPAV